MILGAETTLDPTQLLITQAGVAGLVVVLLIFGQLATGKQVNREAELYGAQLARQEAERVRIESESARRQAMIDTLLAVYHNEILPVLGDYEKKLAPLLGRTEDTLKRMEWIIGEYERGQHGLPAPQADYSRGPRGGSSGGPHYDYSDRGGVGQGPSAGSGPPPEAGSR